MDKTWTLSVKIMCFILFYNYTVCEYLESGFEGSQTSPSIIALAFYDGLWAYDGW
jgi:hypothetical protein